jgi:hypothetical protein
MKALRQSPHSNHRRQFMADVNVLLGAGTLSAIRTSSNSTYWGLTDSAVRRVHRCVGQAQVREDLDQHLGDLRWQR